MIKNRPAAHFSEPHYQGLPTPPYRVEVGMIPTPIRETLRTLRRIEPVTSSTAKLHGTYIGDQPSSAEADFYNARRSEFQLIFVVINSIFIEQHEDAASLLPYAVSLIPASKRGKVDTCDAQYALSMCNANLLEKGSAYLGLDPFNGDWSFYSEIGLISEMGAKSAFTDELGLVHDYFFLRTDANPDEIMQPAIDMPQPRLRNYLRHRGKVLYTPFSQFRSRMIWGVENALELFVLQELRRKRLPTPICQALIFDDGSWHASLYHSWQAFSPDDESGFVSEVDFFFPDQRIALFCDGATHHRQRIRERDAEIDCKLAGLGISSVRLDSKDILQDVVSAVAIFASRL